MRGFTLIELIIVISIVGVISGILGFVLLASVDAWTLKINRADMLWDGRLGMERMVRDIRQIRDLRGVITAGPSELRFIDANGDDITYRVNDAMLQRREDDHTNILAGWVSGLNFTYYDVNGNEIDLPMVNPDETDIRRIRINLNLTKNGKTLYLQSEVVPRNF